ncbi:MULTISPECIES: hypothetical protein [unclassified Mesorhizobium]|uniref:hypothetical protein n=1 Tax=unclassified Mesorhizobium TaxID=325217 RepID=UPI001CCB480D|nr:MULTISPECIES: hypothetical protein [unclassified Mesorhizobium]MBZ9916583.1 hypothetical protein [Mesorhizobium sp. BR1-1-7]MBZ9952874.1 hypothetical protein [Mesorhizobium sp. BR1-1-15]MBZ9972599.1 hypothetical protein [Mesorhizobium sp. BR1-1-12]
MDAQKLTTYSLEQLENLIANYRRQGRERDPIFPAILAARERLKSPILDFQTTLTVIRRAAAEGRFLTYKQVADESGADWAKVHWQMGDHLTRLCEYAHRKGWPLLSAIVVNGENVETGTLKPESLAGFTSMARDFGIPVLDPVEFLRREQQRVFQWANSVATDEAGIN